MTPQNTSASPRNERLIDSILAAGLAVWIVCEEVSHWDRATPSSVYFFLLLMAVPLGWRRRQPVAVFILLLAVAIPWLHDAPYAGTCCIMVAAYSVGAYSRYRFASFFALAVAALVIAVVFHGGLPPIPDAAGPFVVLLPLWLIGNAMRTRQVQIDAWRDRATRSEREQLLVTRAALAEERARIARELHDVLAHSVSVMVVGAGAARQVLSTSPGEARETLLAVESTGREAMTELRSLLSVMGEHEGATLAPQPGIESLDTLLDRVREAGLPVECRVLGTVTSLPIAISLAAYRIVQEALTNALRYSGLAPTTVVLRYEEDELKLEISDEGHGIGGGAGSGQGLGLIGMRDRVALHGGTLDAGPRPGRGFAVRAWLPLRGDLHS